MKRQLVNGLFGLAALAAFAGCGDGDGLDYDEALSSAHMTGYWVYDAGTLCTVGGATMHCCPQGMAMVGAHINNNVFKCAALTSVGGTRTLDVGTMRNGMHACPFGTILVGLHVGNNQLACQAPGPSATTEYVDGTPGLTDSYPMHVCSGGHAMSGIHVNNNLFTCAF